MEFTGKDENEKPYKGFLVCSFLMIIIPIAFTYIIYGGFNIQECDFTLQEIICFGYGIGFLLNISFLLCGLLKKPISLFCQRQKDFFENVTISLNSAIKWHFQDFWKTGGIILWTYISIIVIDFAIFVWGLLPFIDAILQG